MMITLETYTKVTIALNQNIGDIEVSDFNESPAFVSLIYIMKNQHEKYLQSLSAVNIADLEKESLEYFFYVEGRIRYLHQTQLRKIYNKQKNDLADEYFQLCNAALDKYEYSYNATIGLAIYKEKQKKFSDSKALSIKLFGLGYKSEGIVDDILFFSICTKDWETFGNYSRLSNPQFIRWLYRILIFDFKYPILRILFALFCIFITPIIGWHIGLFFILPIIIFLIIIYLTFNRRVLFLEAGYYLFIFLISVLYWLFLIIFIK